MKSDTNINTGEHFSRVDKRQTMTQTVLLGDIAEKITKGTTPTTYGASFTDSGVNFVKVESITEYGGFLTDKFVHVDEDTHNNLLKRSVMEEGDILLTMAGAIGRVAQVPQKILPANTNQAVSIIRVNAENVDRRYIRYFLESPNAKRQFLGGITQSAQPNLSLGNISKIQIPLPNLETQKKIADILGTIDEKIELNRQMNETLEQMGQALFRHYFIDNPEAEKWEDIKIGELVNIKGGGTPSTKIPDFWDGNIAWTSPKDLTGKKDSHLLSTGKTITEQGLAKVSSGLLPENTLLLSSRAPIGYVAITGLPLAINQGYIAFLPDAYLSSYFMYFWLKCNMERIKNASNGSTFMEISKASFRNITTVKPDEKILLDFETKAANLFEAMRNNQEEIKTLTALRDTLLPRLISGDEIIL